MENTSQDNRRAQLTELVRESAKRLQETITATGIGLYVDAIEDLDVDQVRRAMAFMLRTATRLPRPSELRAHTQGLAPEREHSTGKQRPDAMRREWERRRAERASPEVAQAALSKVRRMLGMPPSTSPPDEAA